MKPLDDYVEVSERIEKFYEKYPEGSLQGDYEIRMVDDQTLFVYKAYAFRTASDERPAIGYASEPFPGQTNFTRNSELMNAETSAWGRAIAALGFEVKRGIASRQEVQNRRSNGGGGTPAGDSSPEAAGGGESVPRAVPSAAAMSAKQKDFLDSLLKKAEVDSENRSTIMAWAEEVLTGGREGTASAAIDGLQNDTDETVGRLILAAQNWAKSQSDLPPPDESDLPQEQMAVGEAEEDIPF